MIRRHKSHKQSIFESVSTGSRSKSRERVFPSVSLSQSLGQSFCLSYVFQINNEFSFVMAILNVSTSVKDRLLHCRFSFFSVCHFFVWFSVYFLCVCLYFCLFVSFVKYFAPKDSLSLMRYVFSGIALFSFYTLCPSYTNLMHKNGPDTVYPWSAIYAEGDLFPLLYLLDPESDSKPEGLDSSWVF